MLDIREYEQLRQLIIDCTDGNVLDLIDTLGITVEDILDNFEWEDNEELIRQYNGLGETDWRIALQDLQDTAG